MKRDQGDIWRYFERNIPIIIPTNKGYKRNGKAIMGAGLAKQAALRFPDLIDWYGDICSRDREDTEVVMYYVYDSPHRGAYYLIMFPTKPFNASRPWASWDCKADIQLIEKSLKELVSLVNALEIEQVAIPLVGCGLGELSPDDVIPLMERYLDDRFTLITL